MPSDPGRNPNHAGAQLKLAGIMASNGNQQVLEEAEKRLKGFVQTSSGKIEALDKLNPVDNRRVRKVDLGGAGQRVLAASTSWPSNNSVAPGTKPLPASTTVDSRPMFMRWGVSLVISGTGLCNLTMAEPRRVPFAVSANCTLSILTGRHRDRRLVISI